MKKTKEVIGLDDEAELTRDAVKNTIAEIKVPEHHRLIYDLKDGTTCEVLWQNRSRSKSWTPEMREKARQKALARYRKDEGDSGGNS